MPITFDKKKQRYRYELRRKPAPGQHEIRVRKLLPKGWTAAQRATYDRDTTAKLLARASGIEKERLRLEPAVKLYVERRCPKLANGPKVIQDLAHLSEEIANAYLDEVGELAAKYEKKARAKGLSDGTIHNRLAYLRAAVNYARKKCGYGKDIVNPTEMMEVPTPDNERHFYLRVEELQTLWEALKDDETRAVFTLAFYCGTRWRKELLTRKAEHIVVRGDDHWLELGRTKNGEQVMKFIHPAAHWALAYVPFKWSDSYYYARWHAAVAAIGRPELHPHDLRHSLASEVLNRPGGSLDDVRAALHHESLVAAKRYAHRYNDAQKRILAGIGGQPLPTPPSSTPTPGGSGNFLPTLKLVHDSGKKKNVA